MPDSKSQVRAAHATLAGARTGMPRSFAKEVVAKMHGRSMASLPERGSSPSFKGRQQPPRKGGHR